jgi:hypothetical protein
LEKAGESVMDVGGDDDDDEDDEVDNENSGHSRPAPG